MTSAVEQQQQLDREQSAVLIRMFESLLNAYKSADPIQLDAACNLYKFILGNRHKSKAQLFQDLFVLFVLNEKKNGYFVEFGATNGIELSNTYLLEKNYGWNGILAEPARCWAEYLKKNRHCSMDFRCVWQETGKLLEFKETFFRVLSTIDELSRVDGFSTQEFTAQGTQARAAALKYKVESVSLNDLLLSYNAPQEIDYLSIDTEGSEFLILKNFDFEKRIIKLITVEHNDVASYRKDIFSLLTANGYTRLFDLVSDFDDWYMHKSVFNNTSRTALCPCGSGRRYKHCHGAY
jgi:FkbM family methyltransferase